MKGKTLALILFSFLMSCEKEESLSFETRQIDITEFFGSRTLSWVSPYIGFSQVVYESETGEIEIFDLRISDTFSKGNVYSPNIGQTKDVVFTSTKNPERSFIISPFGNSAFYFSVLPRDHPFNPELFLLNYNPLFGNTYMVQISNKNKDVERFEYKYSSSYPFGVDEEMEVFFNTSSNKLFKSIYLKQNEGLTNYQDLNDVKWKLREIK